MNRDYQFVGTDTNAIMADLIAAYEKITNRTLHAASPDRLFLMWVADVYVQLQVKINYAANQNLPSRASGDALDALGELFFEATRPVAKAATCTMRFHLSEAQGTSILIPVGTRVTDASSTLFWETTGDVYVPIGSTYTEVVVICQTMGTVGNNYVAGQINTLVDLFSYYDHCENKTVSDGGADTASDQEYYELMRASEDAYSTAGPMGAYVYKAKSVSTDIIDVKAIQPKEVVRKTLVVYAGRAFCGGNYLKVESLVISPMGSVNPALLNRDYTVSYEDGLLTIKLASGGVLEGQTAIDISIEVTKAGHVNIYALMKDGTIASETIKEKIAVACNDDKVRPMTDYLKVEDPKPVPYNIAFTYYLPTETTKSATELQEAVMVAVADYQKWQSEKLGRDINPSKLNAILMATGIKRVELIAPVFQKLGDGNKETVPTVAQLGMVSIINGGYENE